MNTQMVGKIGVALACHNPGERLKVCLSRLFASQLKSELIAVVVDDGSTDGSIESARNRFPQIEVIHGSGDLWWAGATNLAIQRCLDVGCEAIVLLNPDVDIDPDSLRLLLEISQKNDGAIVAPVVIDANDRSRIWEAGHAWEPVIPGFPFFWRSRYLFKHGTPIQSIPSEPYPTVSFVGRGGLVPRRVFEQLGLLDAVHFPQYGADAVFGVKAWRAGISMYIVPQARVYLEAGQTGMKIPNNLLDACIQFFKYLTVRKNGERLRVLWYQSIASVPKYAIIPNYIFWVSLNIFRYWQSTFRHLAYSRNNRWT